MNVEKIMNEIQKNNYWDARVEKMESNCFFDEVILEYLDDSDIVTLKFEECYNVNYQHDLVYEKTKPMKEYRFNEIPYYIQDIVVSEKKVENHSYYQINMNIWPMNLEILCKDVYISRQVKE